MVRKHPEHAGNVRAPSNQRGHVAIVLAGGRSAGQPDGPDLALLPLAGRRLVSRAVESLTDNTGVRHVVVAVHDSDRSTASTVLEREVPSQSWELSAAGLSSQQTVYRALEALA